MLGVKILILLLKILSTSKSPSVTGESSGLIVILTPFSLISFETSPASWKVLISSSAISFKFELFLYNL